jgi:hypothetical protein
MGRRVSFFKTEAVRHHRASLAGTASVHPTASVTQTASVYPTASVLIWHAICTQILRTNILYARITLDFEGYWEEKW